MGILEDLQKKLSRPGAEAFSRERMRTSRPEYLEEKKAPTFPQTSDVAPPYLYDAAAAARRRRRRFLLGLLLLLAVLLVAGGTYGGFRWYREVRTVQDRHIQLSLSGPERVTSGEDAKLTVRIENGSRVAWENVTAYLRVPQGFVVKSADPSPLASTEDPADPGTPSEKEALTWVVGSLASRAAADLVVIGRLLGEEGSTALFSAGVRFNPKNRPEVKREREVLATTVLEGIPVDLSLDVPRAAASGTPITVRVVYQNRTEHDLTEARLVLEAPPGFSVSSALPPVQARELTWELPAVPPQGQGEVSVSGIIEGEPETSKPFLAKVGFLTPDNRFLVQRQIQRSLTIESAAFSLAQELNKERDLLKVAPGTEIQGNVLYKNTGTGGLREVIVRLTFEGTGLDAGSVRVEGGFFDSKAKRITWTAASSPALRALRPGESGELPYRFRILPVEALPFASDADRNFSLVTQAVGDSPDLPTPPGAPKSVVTDRFEILLNTVPRIVLGAFYDDGRAGLPVSTGPLPPTVGQETILTVRARIQNTSNEILEATYGTVLPEGVQWVGKEYHTVGAVRYNERTRDVIWTIPLVAARAGVALPGPEFAFQVSITPSLNQVGSQVALTRGHTLEGTDAFTTARLRVEEEAVTTLNVDPEKGNVVR